MQARTEADPQPATATGAHRVGVPASVLASTVFNAHPVPLAIAGTREAHPALFRLLDGCATPAAAAEVFEHHLQVAFGLLREPPAGPRHRRASYLKLLQGWGLDSNGPAGAVLKGWVESRFGLVPGFHKEPLARFASPAWAVYLAEKSHSRWHGNGIAQQLDLLYEYAQWSLARWRLFGGGQHVTLWRATTHVDEQIVAGARRRGARVTVRLNNVLSFALERDRAECFGDWLLAVQVPLPKLLLYPGLLRAVALGGESEVIALGGDYEAVLDA